MILTEFLIQSAFASEDRVSIDFVIPHFCKPVNSVDAWCNYKNHKKNKKPATDKNQLIDWLIKSINLLWHRQRIFGSFLPAWTLQMLMFSNLQSFTRIVFWRVFHHSAYNGCCNVSTYCDTDKRKTAEWTKVSHKCKLRRQLCFLHHEVRQQQTTCSRNVADDSDLHTTIIDIDKIQ